jgi:hypothetical protein
MRRRVDLLDGAERARLLKKLRVQLGNVQPAAKEGYISMRSAEGKEEAALARVHKKRMYR